MKEKAWLQACGGLAMSHTFAGVSFGGSFTFGDEVFFQVGYNVNSVDFCKRIWLRRNLL
jgi:hypothetical protein